MWKILHALFGFDYVHWENSADEGIARVYIYNGKVYYWRYKITNVLDEIKNPDQVVWLTCGSEKYFKVAE